MHFLQVIQGRWQQLSTAGKTRVITGLAVIFLILPLVVILTQRLARDPVPDFTSYVAGPERKEAFFSYFLPLVTARNQEIIELRETLLEYRQQDELDGNAPRTVIGIADDFGMEGFDPDSNDAWTTLMRRVDTIPPSLALAQAANESAWGTSRFARQGNNYYGEWCFVAGCGMVPVSRDAGASHEVASYRSPRESVERYMANINHHNAYLELRQIRAGLRRNEQTISGLVLADGLSQYSERGEEYIQEIGQMIRFNGLAQLDNNPARVPTD